MEITQFHAAIGAALLTGGIIILYSTWVIVSLIHYEKQRRKIKPRPVSNKRRT